MGYDDDSVEPLSLETFDPVYAREPYLNTPRSLEACRHHGVNPEELVEIPFREFQRAYPDDPETALRRFERIDGARRRILDEVVRTWQDICRNERKARSRASSPEKETVIKVEPEKHVTVLEMQAEKFRRVEKQQYKALQNMLFNEMKKAVMDQMAKKIENKQNTIEANKKRQQREHELEVEAKHRREREEQEEREREQMREIREAQKEYLESVYKKQAQDKANERKQRALQLRRETERLEREEYHRKQKEENFERFRAEAIERSRQLAVREKELQDRMNMERKKKEENLRNKKDKTYEKLSKAREELEKMETQKREALTNKINAFDKAWEDKRKEKEKAHREHLEARGDFYNEKLASIRAASDDVVNDKVKRTLSELEQKEEAARQELARVEEQRQRRRIIKEVRRESHELNAIRRKKAEEYRRKKIEDSIRQKNERYQAIKEGEKALKDMTNSMAEVMNKTKSELRNEMMRLNSKDMLTTDNVVKKVNVHSQKVLFPRLEVRFGGDGDETETFSQTAPAALQSRAKPSTATPSRSKRESSKPRTSDKSSRRAVTAAVSTRSRPKSPGGRLPLKVFTKDVLTDTVGKVKDSVLNVTTAQFGSTLEGRSRSPSPKSKGASRSSSRASRARTSQRNHVDDTKFSGDMETTEDDDWLRSDSGHFDQNGDGAPDRKEKKSFADEMKDAVRESRQQEEGYPHDDDLGRDIQLDRSESKRQFLSRSSSKKKQDSFASRKTTPFPEDIERELNRSAQISKSYTVLEEDENGVDRHAGYQKKVESFQSSRKNTPFPGEIDRCLTETRPVPRNDTIHETDADDADHDKRISLDEPDGENDERVIFESSKSAPSRSESFRNTTSAGSNRNTSSAGSKRNERLRPLTPEGHFRREHSYDHPLNGGTGEYKREKSQGKKVINPTVYGKGTKKPKRISEVVSKQEHKKMDLQRQLEVLRKHQNAALLSVLEEEKEAEEQRMQMGKSVTDTNERGRLELIFAEERKRASERIISMTKEHEKKMKEVILAMDLGS